MTLLDRLNALRKHGGPARTTGLPDDVILDFAERDPKLKEAVAAAWEAYQELSSEEPELLKLDEAGQAQAIQEGYVNFYAEDAVNPYVALAARGPWLVTLKGAVLYDVGGYGMIGAGHAPEAVLEAMNKKHVMANIMTPNISQKRLIAALRREIGHTRGECPFSKFLCVNSGSESVTVAARVIPAARHSPSNTLSFAASAPVWLAAACAPPSVAPPLTSTSGLRAAAPARRSIRPRPSTMPST